MMMAFSFFHHQTVYLAICFNLWMALHHMFQPTFLQANSYTLSWGAKLNKHAFVLHHRHHRPYLWLKMNLMTLSMPSPRQNTVCNFDVSEQCGFLPWDKHMRLGEAKNAGPFCNTDFMPDRIVIPENSINIGIINPTERRGNRHTRPWHLERC